MRHALLCAVLLLLGSASVHAQQRLTITAGGGASLSTAPGWLTDLYGYGINLKVGAEYGINEEYGVVVRGSFNHFLLDEDAVINSAAQGSSRAVDGTDVSVRAALAGMRVGSRPQGPMRYYAVLLGGFYKTDTARLSVNENANPILLRTETETKPGVSVGGGIDFGVSPLLSLRFEFAYDIILTEGEMTGYFPLSVMVALNL